MTSKQNEGKMTDLIGVLHESHKGRSDQKKELKKHWKVVTLMKTEDTIILN